MPYLAVLGRVAVRLPVVMVLPMTLSGPVVVGLAIAIVVIGLSDLVLVAVLRREH